MSTDSLLALPSLTLSSPGQIAFSIGQLQLRWYGIFIAGAFLACYFVAEHLVKKYNLNLNHFNNLVFLILIFSVIFARLYFVLCNLDYFKNHLDEIPKIWLGGQSIHGGILGAVLACLIYSSVKQISFYSYVDITCVIAPLGQSIGRWGNFFNNEAYGLPLANGLIGLYIPSGFRPNNFLQNEYFHPTFLYESFLDFLIFIFLYKKYPSWRNNKGSVFWTYLFLYSLVRFFLEFLRIDRINMFLFLSLAQVVSLVIICTSVFMLVYKKYEKN